MQHKDKTETIKAEEKDGRLGSECMHTAEEGEPKQKSDAPRMNRQRERETERERGEEKESVYMDGLLCWVFNSAGA